MNRIDLFNTTLLRLKETLENQAFLEEFRYPGHFIRKRLLSMHQVILFLIYQGKTTIDINIDRIQDELPQLAFPSVSKQAVSKARQWILPDLFKELFRITVDEFYLHTPVETRPLWNGYHLFAIDGTDITLPINQDTGDEFGIHRNQSQWCYALGSTLYDVLNDITADAEIYHGTYPERDAAIAHLDFMDENQFPQNSIVIFDRGYYSFDLFLECIERGYTCLMRLSDALKITKKKSEDQSITLHSSRKSRHKGSCPARLCKVTLSTGETEYLITNLTDPSITADMLGELYFHRWKIETKYGEVKNCWEMEKFNGLTACSIQQEFFICLMKANLTAHIKHETDKEIQRTVRKENKLQYQANRSYIAGRIHALLPRLLLNPENIDIVQELCRRAQKKRSAVRQNRHNERNFPLAMRHYKRHHNNCRMHV